MVVPGTGVICPSGSDVARGVEAVDLRVEHGGGVRRESPVRVHETPAKRAPTPRSDPRVGEGRGGRARSGHRVGGNRLLTGVRGDGGHGGTAVVRNGRGARSRGRRRWRGQAAGQGEGRRADEPGGVADLDAQAGRGPGRGPRVGERGGARVRAVRHRPPVAQDRLGPVRFDFDEARLASAQRPAARCDREGHSRPLARTHRIPGPGLVDAGARQGERRRLVVEEVGGLVTGGRHRVLRGAPRGRPLGGRHVDDRVVLLVGRHRVGEPERGQRRGQHQDARRLPREGHRRHARSEERALRAPVGCRALTGEDAVHAAAHQDVTRDAGPASVHSQLAHLRTQLDGVQAGVRQPRGFPHGVGDPQLRQIRASVKGALPDGLEAVRQDDAAQGGAVLESRGADRGRPGDDHDLGRGAGRGESHQGRGPLRPAVEGTVRHGEGGVGGADADRREPLVPLQHVVPEVGQGCADVERGQRRHLREGLVVDARHGIRQGDGGDAGADEGAIRDAHQRPEVGAQVYLAQRGVVAEGVGRDVPGSAQVDAGERGHVPEGRCAHRLESVGQRELAQVGALEGLDADAAQRGGQGHRLHARHEERHVVDSLDALGNRVGASRVPGGGVGDQARAVPRVQDPVEGLVVRVGAVHLNAGEFGRLREGAHQLPRGDAGPQAKRGQAGHLDEGVRRDPDERARQRQVRDGRVDEGAAAYLRELGGRLLLVVKGKRFEGAA